MITLADLATNSGDKLTQGFISQAVTDNYLLGALTFDNCMNASGTSDLVYGYKRVKTPSSAAFRALGSEPVASEPTVEKKTTTSVFLAPHSRWIVLPRLLQMTSTRCVLRKLRTQSRK